MLLATTLMTLGLATAPAALDCNGPFVPPSGYQQETAFAPDVATAKTKALQQLIARVCQGSPCPELAARSTVWSAGQAPTTHCAMAVLETALVDEWRAGGSARDFVGTIAQRLASVVPMVASGAKTTVVVDSVTLATNIPGAAAWVRDALQQALGTLPSVKLVEAATPNATLVRANIVERSEQQRPVLDVGITIVRPGGELATVSATLPRAVLPSTPTPPPMTSTKALGLTVEARCERRRSGRFEPVVGACSDTPLTEDDRYGLTVEPSEPAWVYVLAYNDRGQSQLLFPAPGANNRVASTTVKAVLDDVRDVTEHIIVVASLTQQPELEALRSDGRSGDSGARGAARLVATRSFVDAVRSRGFRQPAATVTDPRRLVASGPGVATVELSIAHR